MYGISFYCLFFCRVSLVLQIIIIILLSFYFYFYWITVVSKLLNCYAWQIHGMVAYISPRYQGNLLSIGVESGIKSILILQIISLKALTLLYKSSHSWERKYGYFPFLPCKILANRRFRRRIVTCHPFPFFSSYFITHKHSISPSQTPCDKNTVECYKGGKILPLLLPTIPISSI